VDRFSTNNTIRTIQASDNARVLFRNATTNSNDVTNVIERSNLVDAQLGMPVDNLTDVSSTFISLDTFGLIVLALSFGSLCLLTVAT